MHNGIDRDISRETKDLTNEKLVTMSREEACKIIDELPDWADDLITALDYAQGEVVWQQRYVVIRVEA